MVKSRTSKSYAVLLVLSMAFLFSMFYRYCMAVLTPELLRDFSLTSITLGSLSAAYFYSYGLCQIPVGLLADRMGVDVIIVCALSITATGSFVFSTANTLPQLFAGRVLIGLGAGGLYTPALRKLARCFGEDHLSTAIGIMNAVGCAGGLLATVPLAMLIEVSSWRLVLVTVSFLIFVTAVFCGVVLCRFHSLRTVPTTGESQKNTEILEDISMRFGNVSAGDPLEQIERSISCRPVRVLGVTILSLNGIAVAFQGLWGIPFLVHVGGLSQTQAERALMSVSLGTVLGGPLFGIISDRADTERFRMLALALAAYLLIWLCALNPIPLSVSVWIVLCFMMGILTSGIAVHIFSTCQRITYATGVATALSVVNTMGFLGVSLFQPIVGFIVEMVSSGWGIGEPLAYRLAFYVVLISLVVSLWFVVRMSDSDGSVTSGLKKCYDKPSKRTSCH